MAARCGFALDTFRLILIGLIKHEPATAGPPRAPGWLSLVNETFGEIPARCLPGRSRWPNRMLAAFVNVHHGASRRQNTTERDGGWLTV